MQWDCGRPRCPKGETLFSGNIIDVSFWRVPPYKVFFSTSRFLCPKTWVEESANFVTQFGIANEDANLLIVLAKAKKMEDYVSTIWFILKKIMASLMVQHCVAKF